MTGKQLLITDREAVTKSFGKTEKDVNGDVEIVKKWFKSQPHLPEVPDDNMIESFLVTNKFSIERTKQRLDMYYTIRNLIPEVYRNSNPKLLNMEDTFEMGFGLPLPELSQELFRVHIMKIMSSPEKCDTYRFFSHQMNIMEVRLHEDLALGDVLVIDLENIQMGHLTKISPMHLRKATTILEKVFSNRIKRIHIINYPSYADVLVNLCKSVMKPKIFERIKLHTSLEELFEYISPAILPTDYGGQEISLQELNKLWRAKLKEYGDRFDKLDRMVVREGFRPAPLQNDEVLGYHGNFKKLDVD